MEIAGKKHVFFEYVDIHPLYIHAYIHFCIQLGHAIYIPIPPRDIPFFFRSPPPVDETIPTGYIASEGSNKEQ